MTELENWFAKGVSPTEYVDQMEKHKENLTHIYENFSTLEQEEMVSALSQINLRVIVLTEDWCGDAMLNLPILLHITEKADIPVSVLLRDSNLELMDQYLTNGKSRSIPIFIFIDEEGREVGKWGPRAPKVQARVDKFFAELPSKDAPEYKEKWKEALANMTKTFRESEEVHQEVYESLRTTFADILRN